MRAVADCRNSGVPVLASFADPSRYFGCVVAGGTLALPQRGAGASLLRGSVVVGLGLGIELGSLFVRTIILARLLGSREFGIASAINTLGAVIEMISFVGLDRYLVYARDGGSQAALDAAHTLSLARGCIGFSLTVLLAWPVAALIHEGQLGPEFAVLALAPLLRGLAHLGVFQMQRAHRFRPAATADALAALTGLTVSAIVAWLHPDHTAILWGLLAQAAACVLITHIGASGVPYRLGLTAAPLRAALRFGLPLTCNGLMLAASSQLDRMVVGGWLGPAALGLYGLGTTLLMQPINLLMRFATTAWQPSLSAAWHADRHAAFATLAANLNRAAAIAGSCGACIIACLGAPAITMVFGASYVATDLFCALFAGIVGLRLVRGTLNLFGMAAGATADLALCNSAGLACLPLIALALALRPTLEAAVAGGLAAELFALAVTHLRLRRHYGRSGQSAWRSGLFCCLLLVAIATWTTALHPALALRAVACAAGLAVCAGPALWGLGGGVIGRPGALPLDPAKDSRP